MSQPELRRRMRGSDAMFLYFERKEMPLHIGAVAVLDGPFDEASENLLATRLVEIPRYRQRVVFSPMNVTHPAWEDDPTFDITNHIHRVSLDPPGSDAQLTEVSGQVFTPVMDRDRPLWDLTVVDGLEGGRSALIFRVHHSLVDGVSGIGLVNAIFDQTREPRKVEPRSFDPPPLPDSRQVLVEGLAGFWVDAAERLVGANLAALRILQGFTGAGSRNSLRGLLATAPELLRPADRLPFNRTCSGVRGHCWTTMPFGEARAIKSTLGGTINDIVLTTVAGAVSRYVNAHREPVKDRFVRLMVPVNLRADHPHSTVGNEISMLPLSIPLDIDDPAERLRVITMRSAAYKAAHVAEAVALIGMTLGWIPPNLQQSLAALPFLPQPMLIVNMVCTNVPGPMTPLYANGRELLTYYPHVPCGSDVGLSVAVSSYNKNLYYGVTYDMEAAPDGELFRDFIIEAYEELRSAAGVAPSMTAAAPAEPPRLQEEPAPIAVQPKPAVPAETPVAAAESRPAPKDAAAPPQPKEEPAPIAVEAKAAAARPEKPAPKVGAAPQAPQPKRKPAPIAVETKAAVPAEKHAAVAAGAARAPKVAAAPPQPKEEPARVALEPKAAFTAEKATSAVAPAPRPPQPERKPAKAERSKKKQQRRSKAAGVSTH